MCNILLRIIILAILWMGKLRLRKVGYLVLGYRDKVKSLPPCIL